LIAGFKLNTREYIAV